MTVKVSQGYSAANRQVHVNGPRSKTLESLDHRALGHLGCGSQQVTSTIHNHWMVNTKTNQFIGGSMGLKLTTSMLTNNPYLYGRQKGSESSMMLTNPMRQA